MKAHIQNRFLLPVLAASLGLIPASRVMAQTFTNLHSFQAASAFPHTNSDGPDPAGGLVFHDISGIQQFYRLTQ